MIHKTGHQISLERAVAEQLREKERQQEMFYKSILANEGRVGQAPESIFGALGSRARIAGAKIEWSK